MSKPLILVLVVMSIMSVITVGNVLAEDCHVYLGNATIAPCSLRNRVDIPVYINNSVTVGGFTLQLYCTDPSWLAFDTSDPLSVDRTGSRITGWQFFGFNINPQSPSAISVTGVANYTSPGHPDLIPGDGLLFTLHPHLQNYSTVWWKEGVFYDTLVVDADSVKTVCNADQEIVLGAITSSISDPTGNIRYTFTDSPGQVHVGRCTMRGDANGNGMANIGDVIYLVTYLKGSGSIYCSLCSGDANNNGSVNIADVLYLVNYLKGGVTLVPCD
jgi:hypothetical protein